MAEKTRIIDVYEKSGKFTSVFRKFIGQKKDYNLNDLSLIRKLLSNEKARLLHVIKVNQPKSIYSLSKMLDRDFKSVREDVLLLKKFSFIDLVAHHSGKRLNHKPVIVANTIHISVRI